MIRVWKYTLGRHAEVTLPIPEGARLLAVKGQNQQVVLWAEVDTEAEPQDRTFRLLQTGAEVDAGEDAEVTYVGTVLIGGSFALHVYEVTEVPAE